MRYRVYTWDHDRQLTACGFLRFSLQRAEMTMRTRFFRDNHDGAAVVDTWTQLVVAATGFARQAVWHINNLLDMGETDVGQDGRLYDCVSCLWIAMGREGVIGWDSESGMAYLIDK